MFKLLSSIPFGRLLAALLTLAVVAAPLPASAATARKIAYITRLQMPEDATARLKELQQKGLDSDARVKAHMESRGYQVTLLDQSVTPKNLAGYDLVLLSSVVQSRTMADTPLRDLALPLVTWENDLFDSLRLTGRTKDKEYGEVEKEHYIRIINAPHPLAGGLAAGKTSAFPRDTSMGWGVPARSAIVVATMQGDPDKAFVFGYEKGATMDYDFIAPARRVGLFLDNYSFEQLTPMGLALFDAAVDWAADAPPQPASKR